MACLIILCTVHSRHVNQLPEVACNRKTIIIYSIRMCNKRLFLRNSSKSDSVNTHKQYLSILFFFPHWTDFFSNTSQSNLELCWTCTAGMSHKPVGTRDRLDPATTLLFLLSPLCLPPSLPSYFSSSLCLLSTCGISLSLLCMVTSVSSCTFYFPFKILFYFHFSLY